MEIRFRPAGAQDVPALHWALTQLSQDLGDRHVRLVCNPMALLFDSVTKPRTAEPVNEYLVTE